MKQPAKPSTEERPKTLDVLAGITEIADTMKGHRRFLIW